MGLFDKKVCAVCGKQFGLLGGSGIADGQLCNDCKRKFSPYASRISKMTTADVKRHLEYREKNEAELASFSPDTVLGTGKKFYFDNHKGAFVISSRSNFRDGNPDIVNRNQVVNAEYKVNENASEIYKDEENKVSYEPKQYEYDFTFTMKVTVDSPYFDEISWEVNDGDKPERRNDESYNRHDYTCRMIQHILCPKLYPEPEMKEPAGEPVPIGAETWTCTCGQTGNTGRFCSACGKERVDSWDCPNCGQKGNTGKFCSGCGKERPAATKWFCPNCGQENTGKFCSACGQEMPDNVKTSKRITPSVIKPSMKNQ